MAWCRARPIHLAMLVGLPWTLSARPAAAQTVLGRVLDEANGLPVAGAIVRLLDDNGQERAQAVADSAGSFVMRRPATGEYALEATRIGYQPTRSPLLRFTGDTAVPLEILMSPAPVGLPGLEVSVDARAKEFLKLLGLSPASLGTRWMSRDFLRGLPLMRDIGSIIEWRSSSGATVLRPEDLSPGSDDAGLCVTIRRARAATPRGHCALIVVDGVPISGQAALHLDPEEIEAAALLLPLESNYYWGPPGAGGALVLWTRKGGR